MSPEKEGDVPQEIDVFDVSNLMMQELPAQRQKNTFFQKLKQNLEKDIKKPSGIEVIEYDDSPSQLLNTTKSILIPKNSIILEDDGDQESGDENSS